MRWSSVEMTRYGFTLASPRRGAEQTYRSSSLAEPGFRGSARWRGEVALMSLPELGAQHVAQELARRVPRQLVAHDDAAWPLIAREARLARGFDRVERGALRGRIAAAVAIEHNERDRALAAHVIGST